MLRPLAWIYRTIAPDHVALSSNVLPAKHLRFGGPEFRDDAFFLASAKQEARRLSRYCGFIPGHRVLDVGCGVGRLPIGLLSEFGELTGYEGIDVDAPSIRWCKKHIESAHPGFHFQHINLLNQRYNPRGAGLHGFHFPFSDQIFNVIYLYSVFSHMLDADVSVYLADFARILKPDGILFFTAFIEDGVPDVSENPPGYRMHWDKPLHCVRYNRSFFDSLLANHGFRIRQFEYGQETDGQSALYCSLLSRGS